MSSATRQETEHRKGVGVPADRRSEALTPARARLCRATLPSGQRPGPRTPRPATRYSPWLPRCAHPVVRFSINENSSYIAIAMTPITTRPANASGMRCCEPAVCIR